MTLTEPAETRPDAVAETLLELRGLSTHLGSVESPVRAVDDVSFALRAGETFVLLGESGCGKSMIALSIMRLLPHGGRIVDGDVFCRASRCDTCPRREMRRERGGRIGMIFQEPMTSLNPVMTVGEQVAEAVRLHDPESASAVRERSSRCSAMSVSRIRSVASTSIRTSCPAV
jgi:peptide/nickel transport system ATP-binding protein